MAQYNTPQESQTSGFSPVVPICNQYHSGSPRLAVDETLRRTEPQFAPEEDRSADHRLSPSTIILIIVATFCFTYLVVRVFAW